MKSLSLAPLAAGAVVLCGALLSIEASAANPGTIPPGDPRTLDLTVVPMTINEPGTYVVRHNWDLRYLSSGSPGTTSITVVASDVVIDFQGYQVLFAQYGTGVKIKGSNVTLHGGSLSGGVFASVVRSSGAGTVLDNMSIYSYESLQLTGPGAEVRDSDIETHGALVVGNNAVIERNFLTGESAPVVLANDDRLVANRITSYADDIVIVRGNHNTLSDNVISQRGSGLGFSFAISVTGNGNAVLRNTVTVPELGGAVIVVDGAGNTIDANVAPPLDSPTPSGRGIYFKQGGNFYGNNRMWAQTPYELGGLPQTDWGGNVAY